MSSDYFANTQFSIFGLKPFSENYELSNTTLFSSSMIQLILSITFSILLACLVLTVLSGLYLFMHNIHRTNEVMKHPYLEVLPWQRLSFSNKTAIILDYFFRLFMPHTKFGLIGHANRQLAHVDPSQVPLGVKWPILGFWGGCFLGIIATIVVWVCVLLIMPGA